MSNQILVFYGSYRSDRMGIRLAEFVVERFRRRGDAVELIDAKAVNLPMLDRMYKEHPPGAAPEQLQALGRQDSRCGRLRIRHRRIQLGCPAGTEKPHGSFSGGVVLAPRCDRELFGRTFVRRTGSNGLAWHALRDGNGGGFKHDRRRSHWTEPRRRWCADG